LQFVSLLKAQKEQFGGGLWALDFRLQATSFGFGLDLVGSPLSSFNPI